MDVPEGRHGSRSEDVPLRNAMNEVLRDEYVEDCQRGVDKWNRAIAEARHLVRAHAAEPPLPPRTSASTPASTSTPTGNPISKEEWEAQKDEWLPSDADEAYVQSLMTAPVYEPGRWRTDASGSDQLWRVAPPGGTPERVTDFATDIGGYLLAPSGDRIAIWADRDMACADINCASVPPPAAGRGSGRVFDQTFVRHWDTWSDARQRSRIFTFALADGRPQGGGIAGLAEPRRRCAVQAVRRRRGARLEPRRPDPLFHPARGGPARAQFDQYGHFRGPRRRQRAADRPHRRQRGDGHLPAVSPDGRWLAYTAMARPTYEADRQVVQLRNLATGETRALTRDWDRSVGSIAWAPDGRSLYVTAGETLDDPIFRVDVRTGRVDPAHPGRHRRQRRRRPRRRGLSTR